MRYAFLFLSLIKMMSKSSLTVLQYRYNRIIAVLSMIKVNMLTLRSDCIDLYMSGD